MACESSSCAVCGGGIDQNDPAETREFQGQTYCFCGPDCADAFDNNPAAYARRQAA